MTVQSRSGARVTGLKPWEPRDPHILRLLADVLAILDEYVPEVVKSMTQRSILYRLIERGWSKDDEERLEYVVNRGRRSGEIPWFAIADGRTERYNPVGYASADEFLALVRAEAEAFRLDRLSGQPYIELWVEAAGMIEMLRGWSDKYGIPIVSSAGFNTHGARYQAALRSVGRWQDEERRTVVVLVGDYDAAGQVRFVNVSDDIGAIANDLAQSDPVWLEFRVAALTREQIEEYGIRTQSAKARRDGSALALGWQPGDPTAQAEAIPPDLLIGLLDVAIRPLIDWDAYDDLLAREEQERQRLL